jgi:hypothetical protein
MTPCRCKLITWYSIDRTSCRADVHKILYVDSAPARPAIALDVTDAANILSPEQIKQRQRALDALAEKRRRGASVAHSDTTPPVSADRPSPLTAQATAVDK